MLPTFSIPKINNIYPRNNFLNNPLYMQYKNKNSTVRAMPYGLTFYKDFINSISLDADFSIGLPTATYTSTSGIPVMTNGDYNVTVTNADSLKYSITGNRTAEHETIVMKFIPAVTWTGDFMDQFLLYDSFRRIYKGGTSSRPRFDANYSQSTTALVIHSIIPQQNVPYIIAAIAVQSNGNPNQRLIVNNSEVYQTDQSTIDWILPNYSSGYMTIGCSLANINQFKGKISWIKIFNRVLTSSEILNLS